MERRFDHEEAYRLRFVERVPVETLAVKFGVSTMAIYRATEEGYRELSRACRRRYYARRTREARRVRLEREIARRLAGA